jgi:hypothetical protein
MAACVALGTSLAAQRAAAQRAAKPSPRAAAECRVDTNAAWFRAQRTWLDESRGGWTDEALRDALVRGAALDVEAPLPLQLGWEIVDSASTGHADSATVARLRALAAQRGSPWPTRSVVGPAGVRAVWLAAADSALAPAVLHRLMEAGPEESLAADVAVLEDRLRVRAGRKQLYGTQLRVVNGRPTPYPMEDPSHVDLRRDGASLPPLAVSLCLARRAR